MRKILFRGKRIDEDKFVEGLLLYECKDNAPVIVCKEANWVDFTKWDLPRFYFVEPDSIGQYTGMNDMNDTPIFEGDIVRIKRFEGTVEFLDGEFIIRSRKGDYRALYPGQYCEIIGNQAGVY